MKKVPIYLLLVSLIAVFGVSCKSSKPLAATTTVPAAFINPLSDEEKQRADYYFMEGMRLKAINQQDAAFDAFNRALAIDTMHTAAMYSLSNYYLRLRNPIKAFSLLQKSIQYDPNNYWYLYAAANLAQQLNMNEEAIDYYNQIMATHSDKPEIIYSVSEVYVQMGELEKAIQTLDLLEQKMGPMEMISLQKSKLYMTLKQEANAKAEIDKLITAYPNDIRYTLMMGDIAMDSDKRDIAMEYYNKAKAIDPNDGRLQLSLANYYFRVGQQDSAELQIKHALHNKDLEIDVKIDILKDYLKTLYMKKENTQERDNLFDILFESYPQEKELFKLQSSYLITEKRFKEAQDRLTIAVGLDPNDRELWMSLLDVCLRLQEFNEVIATCQKALIYFPKDGEFYYYQSIALGIEEKYQQAIDVLDKGFAAMDKNNPRLLSGMYTQMGDLYHQLKDRKKCFEAYDKALEYYPDNASVLNNYAYFLSLDKADLSRAEQMSAKAVKLEPENSTFLDTYAWIYFQMENYFLAKFYMEKAIRNGGDESDVLVDHYGDILFKNGDVEGALEQWKKALEMNNESKVLKEKIEKKTYIPNPDENN
ncbi:MAG: tetratricopeptide repeat protein [Bacteroidales bacterium]